MIKDINIKTINLRELLNLSILQDFLSEFASATGLRVTLVDLNQELLTAPQGDREFCLYLANLNMRHRCRECDKGACQKAAELKEPYIYHCHAGLIDLVIPIILQGECVGFFLSGQIRLKGEAGERFQHFLSLPEVAEHKTNPVPALQKAYENLPEFELNTIKSFSKMLSGIVNYITHIELQNLTLKHKDTQRSKRDIVEEAKEYVKANYSQNIRLEDVAQSVSASSYYLSHIFKKETGTSFIEYLNLVRIEKARELLKHTTKEVIEIAFATGFNDSNYFSKVFKKYEGVSPRQYRKKAKTNPVFNE